MDSLIYLFAVLVVLGGVLAAISIWSPVRLWFKISALIATGALFGVGYLGFSELLSRPKPMNWEWAMRSVPEAEVLGAETREGEAIFLWLEMRGASEPRAYALPWSTEAAKQLQAAMREAEERDNRVMMREPFRRDGLQVRDEPVFYAQPQAAPDPKPKNTARPLVFNGSN